MNDPILDAVWQPIEEGDIVVYASGSRTAAPSGCIARVVRLKKKVQVEFFNGDGTPRRPKQCTAPLPDGTDYTWTADEHVWLAPESLVVVTAFKTWQPSR